MTTPRDAYAILQVMTDADQAVVQAAYRALARRYHADGVEPDAVRMTEINGAWERIRTIERRARYDEGRRHVAISVVPERNSPTPREPYDPWKNGSSAAHASEAAVSDVIDFGRYVGWRITDLAHHDPDYLRWLSRHSTGVRFLDMIMRCLPNDGTIGRRGSLVG